jgi:hypothetical protein
MPTAGSILVLSIAALTACGDQATEPKANEASTPAPPPQSQLDAAKFWGSGASVYWNGVARDLIRQHSTNPLASIRTLAILSTAQYNAAIAAENAKVPGLQPSPAAAVSGASAIALENIYPTESAALEERVATELSSTASPGLAHTDASSGEKIGRDIAASVVARANADRFFAPFTGTVPVGPGLWFSSLIPPAPPVGATLGQARTYFLTSGDQFRPAPPPAFGSSEFLAALAEVRQISDTRTPEQIAIANFWALPAGTITPTGFWNNEAAILAVRYHLDERRAAHLFALVNMAGFDAVVACFDAKFTYWFIRPTQADPLITLVVDLPNHPSYPSAHACVSGAESSILGAMFPAEKSRLDAMAEEAALSRVFAGLHYRFDGNTGLRLGRTVADLAVSMDVHGHKPFILK